MHNVVVIGGSGFLGTEVAKELLDRGHKVRIFDKNEPKIFHKNLKFIKGNILDNKKRESSIKNSSHVYNFPACAPCPGYHCRALEIGQQKMRAQVRTAKNPLSGNAVDLTSNRTRRTVQHVTSKTARLPRQIDGEPLMTSVT